MKGLSKILAIGFPNGGSVSHEFRVIRVDAIKNFIGMGNGTHKNSPRIETRRIDFFREKDLRVSRQWKMHQGYSSPGKIFFYNFPVPTEGNRPTGFARPRKAVTMGIIHKPYNPRNPQRYLEVFYIFNEVWYRPRSSVKMA